MAQLESTASSVPTLALTGGALMPIVGFGLYKVTRDEAREAALAALALGYRHLDSASFYANEAGVGAAILECGVPRAELFVASKVWTDCIGAGRAAVRASVLKSCELLKVGYLDMAYVHWPCPGHEEAYKELELLHREGLVRHIGLSNYRPSDYEALERAGISVAPVANQIEANPFLFRADAVEFFARRGIATVAYKPLQRGAGLDDVTVNAVARAHGVSAAQVLLRWGVQRGLAVLPKSCHADRMAQNLDLFEFALSEAEMASLSALTTPESLATFETHFSGRAVVDAAAPTLGEYGLLALPSADTASNDSTPTTKIVVGGAPVSLDALGPIVVNKDGTLARINNWHEMVQSEKDTTLRVIAKRNKQRLDILKAAAEL